MPVSQAASATITGINGYVSNGTGAGFSLTGANDNSPVKKNRILISSLKVVCKGLNNAGNRLAILITKSNGKFIMIFSTRRTLFIHSFLLMLCLTLLPFAIFADDKEDLKKAIQPDFNFSKTLYYDKSQMLYYDYNVVCEFQSSIYNIISNDDLKNLKGKKYITKKQIFRDNNSLSKNTIQYTYKNNGMKLIFNEKIPNSDKITDYNFDYIGLNSSRIPINISNKDAILEKFSIKQLKPASENVFLYCDNNKLNIKFNGNKIVVIEIIESNAAN